MKLTILDMINKDKKEQLKLLEKLRFENQKTCPYCQDIAISGGITTGTDYFCSNCNRHFTLFTKTPFHSIKTDPIIILSIIIHMCTEPLPITIESIHKQYKIAKNTAKSILSIIRENIPTYHNLVFNGIVQCDETYFGGKNKNRHKNKKISNVSGRSGKGQQAIFGIYSQTTGKVHIELVKSTSKQQLLPIIYEHIKNGATIYTDEWKAYSTLNKNYIHKTIKHNNKEYVNQEITTNGIENFWSVLKRSLNKGNLTTYSLKMLINEVVYLDSMKKMSINESKCYYQDCLVW